MNAMAVMEDLSNFIDESRSHLLSLLDIFKFEPLKASLTDDQSNKKQSLQNPNEISLDDIVNCISDHVKKSEFCNKTDEPQLPDQIPKECLPHEKLAFSFDSKIREELLRHLRQNGMKTLRHINYIIPPLASTPDEYQANYSAVEKNILYDAALQNMVKIKTPPELSLPDSEGPVETSDDSKLTDEELHLKKLETLKRERDMKRRRIAYRRKVSTKNKSYTEVSKEMISNIMEALFSTYKDTDSAPQIQSETNYSVNTTEVNPTASCLHHLDHGDFESYRYRGDRGRSKDRRSRERERIRNDEKNRDRRSGSTYRSEEKMYNEKRNKYEKDYEKGYRGRESRREREKDKEDYFYRREHTESKEKDKQRYHKSRYKDKDDFMERKHRGCEREERRKNYEREIKRKKYDHKYERKT